MGSGKEIKFVAFYIMLVLAPRSRFFYYIFLIGLHQFMIPLVKLFYAAPRPFWLDERIHPFKCSLCFGSPSGHSFAAVLSAICIPLDLFHGSPTSFKNRGDEKIFYSKWVYYPTIAFAIYWLFSMPYSRFVGGMHSLDQITNGTILGFIFSFICHFIVRDPMIRYFEQSILLQEIEDKERDQPKVSSVELDKRDLNHPLLDAGEKEQ